MVTQGGTLNSNSATIAGGKGGDGFIGGGGNGGKWQRDQHAPSLTPRRLQRRRRQRQREQRRPGVTFASGTNSLEWAGCSMNGNVVGEAGTLILGGDTTALERSRSICQPMISSAVLP